MEQGLRQALRFTTFGFQTVRSDGRTLPERGAFPICDYVRATAELRRHAVVLRVGAILALVSLPALAAAQREVSPYAGFAGIERRLEAIAPEELAAHREATAVFEEARAALRDAAPGCLRFGGGFGAFGHGRPQSASGVRTLGAGFGSGGSRSLCGWPVR